jgi:hypothetical protein
MEARFLGIHITLTLIIMAIVFYAVGASYPGLFNKAKSSLGMG